METLHQQALALAEKDRENTFALLVVLRKIERAREYLDAGVGSLHAYCTKILKYSEGSATRRVNASRLIADVPETVPQYRDGNLNLFHLTLTQSFIQSQEKVTGARLTRADKREVLAKIQGRTQDEARRILQSEYPTAPFGRESTRVVNDAVEIRFLADAAFMADLEAVRAKNAHAPDFTSIMGTFKALLRRELTRGHNAGVVSRSKTKAVHARARAQCEHVDEHVDEHGRCSRRHHLQVDHIIPRALGGTDELSNLQLLCRAHNLKKGAASAR